MQVVMREWPGVPALVSRATGDERGGDLDRLEDALTSFYCNTFYRLYSRPPLVPHIRPFSPYELPELLDM